jgi:hypothetical protein
VEAPCRMADTGVQRRVEPALCCFDPGFRSAKFKFAQAWHSARRAGAQRL